LSVSISRIRLAASNPLVFEKSLVPTLTRLARGTREQEYEQGLGAKLGQAFTQHAPSPGAHTRSSGQAGAHQPSPGTRMMDDD
jgi:hypothetical protein